MFWLLSALMIAVALIVVLPMLLRPRLPTIADHKIVRQENITAAREQLQALHTSTETLSPEAKSEYESEIQNRLLEDTSESEIESKTESTSENEKDSESAKDNLSESEEFAIALMQETRNDNNTEKNTQNKKHKDWAGAFVVTLVLLVGTPLLYWFAGTPEKLAEQPAAHPNIKSAISGLRQHIKANPNDGDALALMGRVLSSMERHREAADHFARARKVSGDLPSLLAANIYALLLSEGEGKAADKLLADALSQHPNSGEIQFLAGFRSRELGENKKAAEYLRHAITLLEDGDDDNAKKLTKKILAEVEREMEKGVQ